MENNKKQMEPPLGQISFFLLCMQFSRSQLENLGAKPFTAAYKAKRAARLCKVGHSQILTRTTNNNG